VMEDVCLADAQCPPPITARGPPPHAACGGVSALTRLYLGGLGCQPVQRKEGGECLVKRCCMWHVSACDVGMGW
jgi:hypothetical protein